MPSPSSPPLRILQVITDTDRRGAQVYATDLGAAMTHLGHTVRTVALAPGHRRQQLDVPVLGQRQRGVRTLRALRREMAAHDITVAHGSSTLLACSLAGLRRRPFVYRQISDSRFWATSWSRRGRVTAYLRRPRAIVALSGSAEQTLTDYLKVPAARITVVPNGVPATGFAPADASQRRLARESLGLTVDAVWALYVGALVEEKGVDTAIAALEAAPAVHLAICGDGPDRARLEALAAEFGDRVVFLGDRADTAPAYAAADFLVLTTRGGDSMPAVLIEAGLCGLPSITCPVGAIGDVVLDNVTGFVIPSDDPAAAAARYRELAADDQARGRLGRAARAHCEQHFTIDVVAREWLTVLERATRGDTNTSA